MVDNKISRVHTQCVDTVRIWNPLVSLLNLSTDFFEQTILLSLKFQDTQVNYKCDTVMRYRANNILYILYSSEI